MTNGELSRLLKQELKKRAWKVSDLARIAGMNYETVRRAVYGIGSSSLENANKLLAAVGHELVAEESSTEEPTA